MSLDHLASRKQVWAPASEEEGAFLANLRNTARYDGGWDKTLSVLVPEFEAVMAGQRSRAFSGVVFDGYVRNFLAVHNNSDGARAEVARLCAISLAAFGPQPWTHLYRGALLHLDGADAAAASAYRLAAEGVDVLWPSSGGARSVVSPEERNAFLDRDDQPAPLLIEHKGPVSGQGVLVVACDHLYLRRFWPSYIRSVRAVATVQRLHLHLLNPASDDLEWVEREAGDAWPHLAVTVERYAGPDKRTYFASSRLLHLRAWLDLYDAPLLVTDVDARFTIDPAPAFDAAADVSLRFKINGYRAHPWMTIQAGVIAVWPTELARIFADEVGRTVRCLFAERAGQGLWYADQNILYSIYRRHCSDPGWTFRDLSRDGLPGGLEFGKTF